MGRRSGSEAGRPPPHLEGCGGCEPVLHHNGANDLPIGRPFYIRRESPNVIRSGVVVNAALATALVKVRATGSGVADASEMTDDATPTPASPPMDKVALLARLMVNSTVRPHR